MSESRMEFTQDARLLAARHHLQAGAAREAIALYAGVLQIDPTNVEALDVLAMAALSRGAPEESVELLKRAHAAAPDNALVLTHLGTACRHARRNEEAEAYLRKALLLDPQDFIARLHLGVTLEELGQSESSLFVYFSAITIAQNQGRWRNDATTAPAIRPLVRHAMSQVDVGRSRVFGSIISPLRERYGRDALRRVERCLSTYLGEIPAAYVDDRQRPTLLYFPDLPTRPWFDADLFPWYAELESRTDAIREELFAVLSDQGGVEPFLELKSAEQRDAYLRGINAQPEWNAFFFYRHGVRYEDNAARCPLTANTLDAVPLVRIREHAPECLFSVLTPGSHILPHYGVTNTRLVTHLPLIVLDNCVLRVGGEDHVWQEGHCITFDDTFLHEAWNRSERTRVVMLMDTWNPYLSDVEQVAIGDLVAAIGDFSRAAMM